MRYRWATAFLFLAGAFLVIWILSEKFWLQWEAMREPAYANCGQDNEDYPGHLDADLELDFTPSVSFMVTYCKPRKAKEPRAAVYLMAGGGLER
jgi:hypothetical protein